MPNLFAYGTLTEHSVQVIYLGRALVGDLDKLRGYNPEQVLTPHRVCRTILPHQEGMTYGVVFDVTNEDLDKLDAYQGELYHRILITTERGVTAWAYAISPTVRQIPRCESYRASSSGSA